MKKKCIVCGKSKKNMIESVSGRDVCRVCTKVHPQVQTQIEGLDAALSAQASTPQEFYQSNKEQMKAEQNLDDSLLDVRKNHKQNRAKTINFILKKIEDIHAQSYQKTLPDKNRIEVKKTLEAYNDYSLEQCAETVDSAANFEDLRGLGVVKKFKSELDLPDPKQLYEELSQSVIDQDVAVKTISSAIVKHFCRIKDPTIKKQNIFLMGPTGSGKTELIRILAKKVNIPLITIDSTSLTAAGYRGNTISELIVSSLLRVTNNDFKLSENSIVFIDEIDKKAHTGEHGSQVGTMSVQQELLKIIEGGVISTEISNPKQSNQMVKVELDTSNILFIAAGAFSGIEKLVDSSQKSTVGLTSKMVKEDSTSEFFKKVSNQTLIKYGLIPEFVGRFSVITHTNPLSAESMVKILKKPDGIVEQYQKMFSQFKCDLNFSEGFLLNLAHEAIKQQIGARGLDRIMEQQVGSIFFDIYDYIGTSIIIREGGKVHFRKRIGKSSNLNQIVV